MSAMHVISASRRTDIPAFYTPWLLRRLEAGHVRVPNPFNLRQVTTVDLRAHKVACLVFWTKDPRPLLPHLTWMERSGHRFIFHVSLTGLPPSLQPHVPPAAAIVEAIAELSRRIGALRVVWRFDPILLSSLTPEDRVLRTFAALAEVLEGRVAHVAISFARYYRQVRTRLRRAHPDAEFLDLEGLAACDSHARIGALTTALCETAASRGMSLFSCAEPLDLSPYGVRPSACIDPGRLNSLFGLPLSTRKDPGQRPECRCMRSIDIGIYGTCPHRCLYCYARTDAALARGERHDPCASRLLGDDCDEAGTQPRLF